MTDLKYLPPAWPRCSTVVTENCTRLQTSAEQFWEKYILDIGPGLTDFGDLNGFKYDLPLALALSWFIVFLCLCKGVKSSGKVVYVSSRHPSPLSYKKMVHFYIFQFTATFPYAVLIALLVRSVTLEGAVDGIKFLFIPKWERLMDPLVWKDAASQMFFSLGVSWGGLIMFGSYNKYKVHYSN